MIDPSFAPVPALLGGALIGVSSAIGFHLVGKVPGISGILGRILKQHPGDTAWRVIFVLGLLAGGWITFTVAPDTRAFGDPPSLVLAAVAGLLVGAGTRIGGGCTSGHGVCGLSRGKARSLVATLASPPAPASST